MSVEFYTRLPEISIPKAIENFYTKVGENKHKLSLNKINIFIGKNNSGKSWLLREIIKDNHELNKPLSEDELKKIDGMIHNMFNLIHNQDNAYEPSVHFLNGNIDKYYSYWIDMKSRHFEKSKPQINSEIYIKSLNEIDDIFDSKLYHVRNLNKIFINTNRNTSNNLIVESTYIEYLNKIYKFVKDGEGNYKKIEIKQNDAEVPNYLHHFTGLNIYDQIKQKLLIDSDTRNDLKEFEEFISKEFFKGVGFSITPGEYKREEANKIDEEKELIIKVGKDHNLKMYDIGTGIQMMIILTWPLFNYDNGIIFIEEPELFIHPKLQQQLIRIYATHERSRNFQFFINTHSNHIIDAIGIESKVNLFAIDKKSKDYFEINPMDLYNKMLYELIGVRPSSIAIANGIIWVEGPSDRIYLNKWIEIFSEEDFKFIEGLHYEFIFYGGSSIKHFIVDSKPEDNKIKEFIDIVKINPNYFLVADSDKGNEDAKLKPNLMKFKEYLNDNENRLWITEGRTIENYIPVKYFEDEIKNVTPINNINFGKYELINDFYKDKLRYKSDIDKVNLAKKITTKMTKDHVEVLDLKDKIMSLISLIKQWNH